MRFAFSFLIFGIFGFLTVPAVFAGFPEMPGEGVSFAITAAQGSESVFGLSEAREAATSTETKTADAVKPAAGADAPLRVAINAYYPPFSFYDDAGMLAGFDVDIAKALCKALGRECVLVPMAFAEILPAFQEGLVDFSVASMGSSPERRRVVDFTEKYYRSRSIYVARQGEFAGSGPEHFKGKILCARTGTLQERYLRGSFSEIAPIISTTTMEDIFDMVREHDADVALVDGLSGYYLLRQELGEGLEALDELVTVDNDANVARVAVSQKNPGLVRKLDGAIRVIRANGEYHKVNRKYFSFDIY